MSNSYAVILPGGSGTRLILACRVWGGAYPSFAGRVAEDLRDIPLGACGPG
jgi:hypothetical protein